MEAERTRRSPATVIVAFCAAAGGRYVAAERECRTRGWTGSDWIQLFDGTTLTGWVHLRRQRTPTRSKTAPSSAARSRQREHELVSLHDAQEFDDFELEPETMVDRVTNQGIQIRSRVRPVQSTGRSFESFPGRVNGPQVEVRRFCPGAADDGTQAYGRGALNELARRSPEKIAAGHHFFVDHGWNKLRIVAHGPRIQTRVNGQAVEDPRARIAHKTRPSGFIGLADSRTERSGRSTSRFMPARESYRQRAS